jgi:hypothetical protein
MKLNPISANCNVVEYGRHEVLFSCKTPVAAFVMGKLYRTGHKWSVTTSKHINKWLDGRDAEIKEQSFFDDLIK